MDVKSGRPVDVRTLGGGWSKLFEGFTKKSENARKLKEEWDRKHSSPQNSAASRASKI